MQALLCNYYARIFNCVMHIDDVHASVAFLFLVSFATELNKNPGIFHCYYSGEKS